VDLLGIAVNKKARIVMKKSDSNEYAEKFDSLYHLERFRRNIDISDNFNKRTANSDRSVLKAITYVAMQNGGYSVTPGERMLSEISGKDTRTVGKSLFRLTQRGWLDLLWEANFMDGKASRWRINWDATFLIEVDFMDDSEILLEQMLWSGYCLGENSRNVYRAIYLDNAGLKKRQISRLTFLGYKSVDTALRKLKEAGLVIQEGRRYYLRNFESIDERQEVVTKIKAYWNVEQKHSSKISHHETDRVLRARNMYHNPHFLNDRSEMYKKNNKFR